MKDQVYDVPGATVKARRIELQEIYIRAVSGGWVSLKLQESTGSVIIQSDFGSWSYFWPPAHRGQSLPEFLSILHSDYAGGKFLGGTLWVYDPEQTLKAIRLRVCEDRRDGDLDEETARYEWNRAEECLDSFDIWCHEAKCYDASELRCTRVDHGWAAFWERLWKPFVRPALRKLAEECR